MKHTTFIICILSLCTCSVSFAFSTLFYSQYKKRVIITYAVMLFMIMLLVISRMAELYALIIQVSDSPFIGRIVISIEKIAFTIGILAGPLFFYQLIGIDMSKRGNLLFTMAASIYAVAALVEIISFGSDLSRIIRLYIGLPLLFGVFGLLCVIAGKKLESLGNQLLNKTLKLFFILSLLVFPAALYKYINDTPYFPYHLENSLSLLVITILSIVFGFRFFNQPTFYQQGNLSDFFKSRFGTTAREDEIILNAVQGKTNNEIADSLCISVRTVESHLYNVFQKTGVKNRIQLLNLITTNRAD